MRLRSIAMLVLAGLAAVTAGCGDDGGSAEDASFELRVGNVLPFTGDLAPFGPSLDRSARIAADEVNKAVKQAGVDGVSVTIVDSQDDETRSQAGVEAARKLVQTDDVQVLVGSMASNVTLAIAQSVAIPNEVVMITPTSTTPEISDLEDDDLVWRILASDTLQGQALARATGDAFGKDATVNLGARNDAFGVALKDLFREEFEGAGGKVGVDVTWNPESPSFDTEASRLIQGSPDGWVIIDFPETYARFGPALVRAGGSWAPSRMLMTEAMRNEESLQKVGEEAAQGLRGTAPTSEDAPGRPALDRLFKARAEDEPLTGFEGSSFDSVVLAFLAALRGGDADPSTIKQNLRAVSGPPGRKYTFQELDRAIGDLRAGKEIDYEGAWGPIDWDNRGDPTSALYELWRYRGEKIDTLKTFTFGG